MKTFEVENFYTFCLCEIKNVRIDDSRYLRILSPKVFKNGLLSISYTFHLHILFYLINKISPCNLYLFVSYSEIPFDLPIKIYK